MVTILESKLQVHRTPKGNRGTLLILTHQSGGSVTLSLVRPDGDALWSGETLGQVQLSVEQIKELKASL